MVADIRGIPNLYVLEVAGSDVSDQTTSAALGKASRSAQTFKEFRDGGPFALKISALQNFATGSLWDLAVNAPGTGVTAAFYPLGNATGQSLPKFTATATVSAPTSDDYVGGEGGAVDAESPTVDMEWLLAAKWSKTTVS